MGKSKGRRQERRLVDMATIPKDYKPPPVPPAVELNFKAEITETDELRIRQVVYTEKIVDFAIMQLHWEGQCHHQVARIDCCHSMIHRHQFTRDGHDLYDRLQIKAIPADGGTRWNIVDAGYHEVLALMYDEWEDNLRRWRDGR